MELVGEAGVEVKSGGRLGQGDGVQKGTGEAGQEGQARHVTESGRRGGRGAESPGGPHRGSGCGSVGAGPSPRCPAALGRRRWTTQPRLCLPASIVGPAPATHPLRSLPALFGEGHMILVSDTNHHQ